MITALLFVALIEEFLLDDGAGEGLLTDTDLNGSVEGGIAGIDEGHTDALVDGEAVVAGGDDADLLAIDLHGIAIAGDGLVVQLDADNLLGNAVRLLLGEGFLTDELGLVQLDEDAETCHEGRDFGAEFVTVERQGNLETKRVAAAETAGGYLARTDERVPYLIYICVRAVDLETVLARVTCAADDDGLTLDLNLLEGVEGKFLDGEAQQTLDLLLSLGTLDGHLTVGVGLVVDLYIVALALFNDPSVILVDIGCIDDQQVEVALHAVDKKVIDAATVGVAHDAVVDLAVGGIGDVVGEDVVDELLCIGAADKDLTHVADIEDAGSIADGHMLVLDGGVLDGHVKSSERAHLGVKGYVLVIQTGFFVFFHK